MRTHGHDDVGVTAIRLQLGMARRTTVLPAAPMIGFRPLTSTSGQMPTPVHVSPARRRLLAGVPRSALCSFIVIGRRIRSRLHCRVTGGLSTSASETFRAGY